MLGTLAQFVRQIRQPALAMLAVAAMALPALSTSAAARGPDTIADVAEKVIDAVVNISTSQKVETRNSPLPQLPNDPQLDELFKDFFNRRGDFGFNCDFHCGLLLSSFIGGHGASSGRARAGEQRRPHPHGDETRHGK